MIRLNGVEIKRKFFPDGTFCLLDIDREEYKIEQVPFLNIEWIYSGEDELSLLFMLKLFLDEHRYRTAPVILWLYYIPNARMDRVKKDCEVFTLKYFARFINSLCFYRVYVYDPHSNVSTALINCVDILNSELNNRIVHFLKQVKCDTVYFPDESAMKRYGDIVNRYSNASKETNNSKGTKLFYAEKHRDWDTGEIKGIEIKSPSGLTTNDIVSYSKNIVIIDDIISHGGSIYYGLKKLIETDGFDLEKTNIYIYASHVENSITEGKLWEEFIKTRKVFLQTTNSIEHTQEILEYVSEFKFLV